MPLMYIYDYSAAFSKESPQERAPLSSATQVSVSPPNILQQPCQHCSHTNGREAAGRMLVPSAAGGNAAGPRSGLHLRPSGSP